ncbi:MAG: EAL domain-containing protein, partial [Lysobacter sp.]
GTQAGLNRMIVDKSGAIRFRRYGRADGLPDMTIEAIVSDASGALWIGTDRGLARWDSALDRFQSFLPTDGVPDNGINERAALLARDGSLYFGSSSGLLKIDPVRMRATDPAPLVLSSYEIGDNRTINLRGRALQFLHAVYDAAVVTFRVAVPGDDRRLSYRLLGLDDRWQDMPVDPSIRYHGLPRGDYRFQVRQMDSRGRWLEPDLSVALTVAPPPWHSAWAYLAYVVAALAVVAALVQSYLRRRRRRREHLQALREHDERLTLALWASGDVMIEFELDGDRVNHIGERFLGYRPADLPTRIPDYLELIHPDDAPSVARFIEAQRDNQDREQDIEYRLRSADGETVWVRMRGRPIEREADGNSRRSFAGMVSNIAEERRSRESLRRMANYDVLTGLPNRSRFQSDLTALIDGDPARQQALLFIDLDRFKNVNDSLGHQFGDKVLIAAAMRLAESLPPTATLARLGGDEFTVILPDCRHESEAAATASHLLEAFERPLRADASDVIISASIGISLFPSHATDMTLLIQYADSAMYYAKESGRNAFRVFQPEMVARVSRRHALETCLRRALEREELYLVFQPRLDIASGRSSGAEVLLRWHCAEFGEVSPSEFIPILEDTGVIEGVGIWLLENIALQLNAWRAAGLGELVISVNVSVHQLIRGRLSERVAELLATHGLPKRVLELEITESAIMENADRMKAALVELKELDLRLSIDDFGTGYSSFAHLSQLPFDTLKIDKMFIDSIGASERANTLCTAIVAMAHNLGLSVVAEGVEHEAQVQALRVMGCDELQGYWYSKPLPCDEFERWLIAQGADA